MKTFIYHYLIFKILVKGEKHLNKDLIVKEGNQVQELLATLRWGCDSRKNTYK